MHSGGPPGGEPGVRVRVPSDIRVMQRVHECGCRPRTRVRGGCCQVTSMARSGAASDDSGAQVWRGPMTLVHTCGCQWTGARLQVHARDKAGAHKGWHRTATAHDCSCGVTSRVHGCGCRVAQRAHGSGSRMDGAGGRL